MSTGFPAQAIATNEEESTSSISGEEDNTSSSDSFEDQASTVPVAEVSAAETESSDGRGLPIHVLKQLVEDIVAQGGLDQEDFDLDRIVANNTAICGKTKANGGTQFQQQRRKSVGNKITCWRSTQGRANWSKCRRLCTPTSAQRSTPARSRSTQRPATATPRSTPQRRTPRSTPPRRRNNNNNNNNTAVESPAPHPFLPRSPLFASPCTMSTSKLNEELPAWVKNLSHRKSLLVFVFCLAMLSSDFALTCSCLVFNCRKCHCHPSNIDAPGSEPQAVLHHSFH